MSWQSGEPSPGLCVHPSAAANLDEAHAAIEQWEHYSHKRLDEAQRLAVEHMLAIRSDGMWAARTTGRAVPRQNGKGEEIEVVEAWDLTQRGAPIVHTAHEIPTSVKAHQRLVAHLQVHRDLRRHLKKVRSSNGDRSIEMVNGGVIVYRTRTAGGGRGLDDIARLVVDEAQHAQPEQLAASTPILAVNPNPQTNFMGSAGVEDRSEHWWMLRKRALAGDDGDFAWLEHSAEQVTMVDDQIVSVRPNSADVAAWIKANPGFPSRIPPAFLAEQLKILGADLFAREHLCVWDTAPGDIPGPISVKAWIDLSADRVMPRDATPSFFATVSPGNRSAAIGVAFEVNGKFHVELADHGTGMSWLVPRIVELAEAHSWASFTIENAGAVGSLLPELAELGIEPETFTQTEMGRACGHLQNLVENKALTHSGDPRFISALSGAVKRGGDEGLWTWGWRKSSSDITPLVAITGALWAAVNATIPAIR